MIEANLDEAETVLALTNDDEDNLMVSVLVEKFAKDQKKIEEKRTMALINKPNYTLLQSSLKINDLIDPRMSTVSSILKHVHKGTIETAYTIMNGEYEVIEAEIIETSELINKELNRINDFLQGMFRGVGIKLVDFKVEFGRYEKNGKQEIILADEISPDTCRLWDVNSDKKLDKDRFRKGLGNLIEAYQEVARRLDILHEQSNIRPLKYTKPQAVKIKKK